ncbi:hypothetical protein Hanom_Chr03g00249771 [Helianthus anomalus]
MTIMIPSKMLSLCIMLVFVCGMITSSQLSLALKRICRTDEDCSRRTHCRVGWIPKCLIYSCVCIRPPKTLNIDRDINYTSTNAP